MTTYKSKELYQRILFSIFILIVCRTGAHIPIPGIDSLLMQEVTQSNQGGLLSIFNMLSGGSLGRMSIFALAIMPYITASIIMQILSFTYPAIKEISKLGESGKRKISKITLYLTIALAIVQSYGIAKGLQSSYREVITMESMTIFSISTVITLLTGTLSLVWLAERINQKGLGNGSSLIIFVGIVSGLPSGVIHALELSRRGMLSILSLISIIAFVIAVIALVVFVEQSQRRIQIHYPRRQVGNKVYGGDKTYLPLKINTAGVIPPIFAGSLLSFLLTALNLVKTDSKISQWIASYLGQGKPVFLLLYMFLIVSISFFCAVSIFNAEETSENLRKYGAYVPGKRPGKNTAEYFSYVSIRLTALGALYLCCICVLPEMLFGQLAVTFALSGTSILIVVNVILDTLTQIQTFMFSGKYESLIKKIKKR
jgi:preprotein translocase subunit SecY